MIRNTTHGNWLVIAFPTISQGDIEQLGCFNRIIHKEFIKITHAIKQQHIHKIGFDFEVLLHHRSVLCLTHITEIFNPCFEKVLV